MRIIFLLIFFSGSLHAEWVSLGAVDSIRVDGQSVAAFSGPAHVEVTVLAADLFHVRLVRANTARPHPSWAARGDGWPATTVTVTRSASSVTISTSACSVVIARNPLRLAFTDGARRVINRDEHTKGMSWNGEEIRVWKEMPEDEFYYGFGEKSGHLEKKFSHMTMWNSDIPGYAADTDPLYESIPFFYGIRAGNAYAILLDNSWWSSFDMGKESRDQYSFGAESGELSYYFFAGPTPRAILSRFTELVGRTPLPPRWSLGYQQCRWSYSPEQRVRQIASGFRTRRIPCDVIYLDIDYMDGYRIFTWNRKNFPEPGTMIRDLGREGFKIAVIVDPGIKTDSNYHAYQSGLQGNHFVRNADGSLFLGTVWPGECAFPDFADSAARVWWGRQFAGLINDGVRGWWNDMNEPSVFNGPSKTIDLSALHMSAGRTYTHAEIHNVYGTLMTRATYEGVLALKPNERPFVLTRAAYTGGHRFSAAWTGDNISSWEHLRLAIPMCLNLSISGQPFVGSDIGGFIGRPGGELFARWLQLGVFTPLMRAHSVINEADKEPWQYGDTYTDINRSTIELRYRLLPYLYSAMHYASVTGIPPMRPLVFDYPTDPEVRRSETEFLFGPDLLVAPVITPGATTRRVRLPSGWWCDFWTDSLYAGNSSVEVRAPLEQIPIFVRAGAVIPSQQIVQYTDEAPIDPLTLTVYPSPAGSDTSLATEYYEDDGLSFAYTKGVYYRREILSGRKDRSLIMRISAVVGSFTPVQRSLIVRFVRQPQKPVEVTLNGRILHQHTGEISTWKTDMWMYDAPAGSFAVKTLDRPGELVLRVRQR
jgi:alpha-glucosidase